jgi:hypothetical protein
MLFPGRYGRRDELRRHGRTSVRIMLGIIPLLLIAGAIEAFISPSDAHGLTKSALGICFASALLTYIVLGGAGSRSDPEAAALQDSS